MAYTDEEMAHYQRLSNDYVPDAQVFKLWTPTQQLSL